MDLVVFLPLLIIMGAFMYFASRRQKKAMQATIDLHNSLQVGDRVHTTSGLQATITEIDEDTVDLEIAPGVVTTWMKLAVRDKIADEALAEDGTWAGENGAAETLADGPSDPAALDASDPRAAAGPDSTSDSREPRSASTEITDRPNTRTDS